MTGAGGGVGRAIALRLVGDGYAVSLVGRSAAALEETRALLESHGGSAVVVVCDVADREQVRTAVERTDSVLGPIQVLINNAGIAESAPFASMQDELWDRTIAVNLTGTYNLMRAVVPGMFARRQGRIINVASTAAKVGYAYTSAYVASKHGVLGLTRAVAIEARRYGVTVNAVCPGWIAGDMTERSIARIAERTGRTPDEARRALAEMNRSRRLIGADEVADVCARLASDEMATTTGEAIDIE